MATSGTTAFTLDVADAIEEAYKRATGGQELRSGYQVRSMIRSLNLLLLEWANQGINLWTVEQGTVALTTGDITYDLPADTVDLIEHVVRQTIGGQAQDIHISRISVSTYSTIPNKTTTGRPTQIYINRQSPIPTVTVWPAPQDDTYTLVYWRLRRVQDAGTGVNTFDIPFRFLNALVAGLAYMCATKLPDVTLERLATLETQYNKAFQLAADEDREKASARFLPRIARI
jgi:hypothetical protein